MTIIDDQEETTGPTTGTRISRRTFVGVGGALVVSFTLPRYLNPASALAQAPLPPVIPPDYPAPAPVSPVPTAPEGLAANAVDSWLRVGADNNVTIFSGKCELGTGTATATLQIAADQLSVAMDQLHLVEPDTWLTVDQGYSSGSMTMKTQWAAGVRQACAAARTQLLDLASTYLGQPVSALTVANGTVSVQGDSSRYVTYGELIGDQLMNTKITVNVSPVPPGPGQLVGTSVQRIDIPDKVTANFSYVQDVQVPGMLHGRVVRPPTVDSTLVSVDQTPRGEGVLAVVVKDNFVGVVAEKEWQAIDAASALQPNWNVNPLPAQSGLYDSIVATQPATTRILVETLADGGSVEEAISESPVQMSANYNWPYQMHGPIGPPCAIADVQPGGVTVWSGSQGIYPLRDAIAVMLDLPTTSVHVIYYEASGCYGLDGEDNAALDAVLMSQATGSPVRVQYMREDAHAWENYGQAMSMQAQAGLDGEGNILAWNYVTYIANRGGRPAPAGNLPTGGMINLLPAPLAASPPPEPPLGPDSSNAVTSYNVPRSKVVTQTVPSRLWTGPLRSPNRIQNTFANECFMDEMAVASKADPLAFRLKYLTDPRLIGVFQRVTDDAKWKAAVPHSHPGKGQLLTGRGLAGMQYEGTGAYAAVVVDLTVDTKTGVVQVNNVWAAQDCGICLNPDGMLNQAQGCCIQGISRGLKEEVLWSTTSMETIDWVTYPILRFEEMPDSFNLSIIDQPAEPVLGAGEVTITAIVAAMGNAIYDATGARLREVPFNRARVLAALKAL
jgi:CO/xanthine dehydrogenase Mo-binding subunit